MVVRQAQSKDIDRILVLTNSVADKHGNNRSDILLEHPYHITREKLERNIVSNDHMVVVADEDGEILGVVLCSIRSYVNDVKYKNAKTISVEDTCVDMRFRSKQVGSRLIEAVKQLARKQNCSRLETNVWSFNDESAKFFQANGFQIQRMIMECLIDEQ